MRILTVKQAGRIITLTKLDIKSIPGKDKKLYASSVKIKVLIRIFDTLRENNHINRTNLTGKTGLNYDNCMKYLNLLIRLGWVESVYKNGRHYLTMTESGIDISEKFSNL